MTTLFLLLLLITTTVASPPSQHSDRIIEAMIGAGDFHDWATDFFSAIDDNFGIPLSATIFIPSDFDAAGFSSSSSSSSDSRRLSVAYHIVPQRLSFSDLRILEPLSHLPTLLPGNSIVVTNNSVSGYTLDGVLVTEPDLFLSSSVAIHGVASSLDFSLYGEVVNGDDSGLGDSLHRFRRRPPPGYKNNETSVSSASFVYGSFLLFPLALALF
ncbi:hypothetical protein AALP_AA1G314400 [Arabis alpina]|uniref:FAS1 domain-containing protein n=1 Tax=Arabis alpina TaxID=50452 RepID=A0A087HRX5_ARAAL|nr:hypothetical protein AALP_AA1G314400 [Arabis alpina]